MWLMNLLAGFVMAQGADVPDYMKGAIIQVKTRDGRVYEFKGEDYKVVKRSIVVNYLPTPLIAHDKQISSTTNISYPDWIVSVGARRDSQYKIDINSNQITIQQNPIVVPSVQLQRRLDRYYLGVGADATQFGVYFGVPFND